MRLIGAAPFDAWWNVVRECRYASFFHTPAWATVVESTYPGVVPWARLFELDDGEIAVLPAMKMYSRLRGRVHVVESMPPSVRGGPICRRTLTQLEVQQIRDLTAANGVLAYTDSGNPLLEHLWGCISGSTADYTHLLRLDGFVHDEIWRGYSKGNKSSTRKGQRAGVEVRRETDLRAYEAYYEIYLDTLRRWGNRATSTHPKELFTNICASAGEHATLWLAYLEERPVAGALLFYWNGWVTYWHGAAREEAMHASPTNVAIDTAIQDAIVRRAHVFDFGESGGHEGVERFKESFGATKLCFSKYYWERKWLMHGLRKLEGALGFE